MEDKVRTAMKNFKPKINLNHNIYLFSMNQWRLLENLQSDWLHRHLPMISTSGQHIEVKKYETKLSANLIDSLLLVSINICSLEPHPLPTIKL